MEFVLIISCWIFNKVKHLILSRVDCSAGQWSLVADCLYCLLVNLATLYQRDRVLIDTNNLGNNLNHRNN